MAIDENVAVVAPLADGITYPVLVDTEHRLPELYAVNNVPTVVWPDDADFVVPDLDDDEITARLHFRLAVHARRAGRDDVAERHFEQATALAPHDFTIVRAAMPLTGVDPFGPAFFELYGVFEAAGSPYRGIRRPRT